MNAASNVVPFPGAPAGEELVRLTPGSYTAFYERQRGVTIFRGAKLEVLFRLVEHADIVLARWYRVRQYRGRVSAGKHSAIVREVSAVLGQRIRGDRIPVASLAGIPVRVMVATVTVDQHQRELAPVNQYSVIERVEGRA